MSAIHDESATPVATVTHQAAYLAPAIVALGSLDELTRGGTDGGPLDSWGTSGADGSI